MSRHLNAEQVQKNWDNFMKLISNEITGERKDKLTNFYDKNANRFAIMPASGKTHFHNAFVGGYIDHVLRVHDLSFQLKEMWHKNGATIDFTDEELSFVAINHDLGKFGSEEYPYYIEQTNDWARENKNELYVHNPVLQFMKTSDRSLFLLQQLGIPVSQKEWLAIHLHDGLYEEGAKSYYIAYSDEYRLRSNLVYIVHQADLQATRIEYDLYHTTKEVKDIPITTPLKNTEPVLSTGTSKYAHLLTRKK